MNDARKQKIRDYLLDTLKQQGDQQALNDSDSLFASGRLDSVAMMMLVVFLENEFAVDFKGADFEVSLIDSVDEITQFVAR
jgi:acyl carrier protein